MKKKVVMMVLCVMLVAGLCASRADADWRTCRIDAVGRSSAYCMIQLTDTGGLFTKRWFTIAWDEGDAEKERYQAALTAFATNSNVLVMFHSQNPPPEMDWVMTIYALKTGNKKNLTDAFED
jgi:hypothetical protein